MFKNPIKEKPLRRKDILGTSLVVQWLRLPMQGAWVRFVVRELDPMSIDRHWGYFHVLAIVNNIVRNTGV